MRKIIYIFLLLISYTAYSQSLSVFNVDASNFPTIKANFFAFDAVGKQITNLSPSDFSVKENGVPRIVTSVSCPETKAPMALSSVLVIDVSGSMCGSGLDIAKAAANAWINMIPLGKSECAITSFSNENYINQDFTTDKTKLFNAVNSLNCLGGTDYNAAMLNAMAGGVLIAKTGREKEIIVFLSDGGMNFEPKTSEIIKAANDNNIAIYCVTLRYNSPQCMKDFSNQTGGLCFENIGTKEEAEDCYRKILMTAQGSDPCQIEWQSGFSCVSALTNVDIKLISRNLTSFANYQSPNSSVAKLEIIPPFLKFKNAIPGIKKDTTITVKSINSDFNITNITSSNPAYSVAPTSFFLISGQSQNLTVSYIPADSGYTYTKFTIENENCPTKFYASGGYPGKKAKIQTLKLIQPNGGETFVVGMNTSITWEGVTPQEKVKIEYTTNQGTSWFPIADSAKGLEYKWTVPKTPSNSCLARITAKYIYNSYNETEICNQIWMSHNLDVDIYRDGTPIPEVTDPTEWANLTTGAWCYYNNDPVLGVIYGKLYNWYAVNDPRGLAPEDWHIPTDAEWTELSDCLGGAENAGGKLKEVGNSHWKLPNLLATNVTGFSALPGGSRSNKGTFCDIGDSGLWWSSTRYNTLAAWCRYLTCSGSRLSYNGNIVEGGMSIRCIKD